MKQEIANTVFLQDKFWYRDREGSPACVPELAQKSFRLPARMGLFSLSRHTLKNLTQMGAHHTLIHESHFSEGSYYTNTFMNRISHG